MSDLHPPLDAIQVARIEGVHRGFLYQHLFAVACLLTMDRWAGQRVVVEHDDDVQAETSDGWNYFQVKYRTAESLSPSDVEGIKSRFDQIRELHLRGTRKGRAAFYVVANCPASAQLAAEIAAWPPDVAYVHPGTAPDGLPLAGSVGAPPTLIDAFTACRGLASKVKYSRIESATLVDKLVAHVAMVSTGRGGGGSHVVVRADLPRLFEQFVIQLHHLPASPVPLRPSGTPLPETVHGVRIIEGYPGMGKTTWAAQAVRHSPRATVYFDAEHAPRGGLVPALVREVLATLGNADQELTSSVLATGLSGNESLAMIDRTLSSEAGPIPLVVVDNAHRADVEALVTAIRTAGKFDWLVLGRPGDAIRSLAALTGVPVESLLGWTEDAVAREAADSGLAPTPRDVCRLQEVTEGNPLFIRSILRLAKDESSGDVGLFLDAFAEGGHLTRTDQERVLSRVVGRLSEMARKAMPLLGMSSVPLPRALVEGAAAGALGMLPPQTRSAIRDLVEWSVLEVFPGGRVRLRDAYAPVALELRGKWEATELTRAATTLAEWAFERVEAGEDQVRSLLLYVHLLPLAGNMERLIEVTTSDDEFFIEVGLMPEIKRVLIDAVGTAVTSEKDRFAALDTLAFGPFTMATWIEPNTSR